MLIGSSRRGRRRGLLLAHCTPHAFVLSFFFALLHSLAVQG